MGKYKPTQLKTDDKNYDAWCYNTGKTYAVYIEDKEKHKVIRFKLRLK